MKGLPIMVTSVAAGLVNAPATSPEMAPVPSTVAVNVVAVGLLFRQVCHEARVRPNGATPGWPASILGPAVSTGRAAAIDVARMVTPFALPSTDINDPPHKR